MVNYTSIKLFVLEFSREIESVGWMDGWMDGERDMEIDRQTDINKYRYM